MFLIMTRTTRYAFNPALPAIAAVLALSSTPSFAQVAQPTEPAPVTETAPPPVTDATPATTDTSPAATATEAAPRASTATTTTRARTTRATRPAPRATTVSRVTHTQVTHQAAAAAPAAAPAPAAKAPAPAANEPAAPNSQSAVSPVVDLNAKPAGQKPASRPATNPDQMMWIGGAALVLIALLGIVFALVRRRREARAWHEDWEAQPAMEHETAVSDRADEVEPRHDPIVHDEERVAHDDERGVVEPSAFAWGATAPASQTAEREDGDDRLPGETWVQRAYRGPSANNPSVSLKNRLRRAAFFDKRERDVAAGLAEPVDPDAGLPDAMTDEQERELA